MGAYFKKMNKKDFTSIHFAKAYDHVNILPGPGKGHVAMRISGHTLLSCTVHPLLSYHHENPSLLLSLFYTIKKLRDVDIK